MIDWCDATYFTVYKTRCIGLSRPPLQLSSVRNISGTKVASTLISEFLFTPIVAKNILHRLSPAGEKKKKREILTSIQQETLPKHIHCK